MVRERQYERDYRQMIWLACPIFFELMLRTLLGNIDQLMLSRYSPMAVAAVGNANQVINMLILVLHVVCMASTIIISQCIGSGKREELPELYTLTVALNISFSVILSFAAAFSSHIFQFMKLPQELIADTGAYIGIVGSCFVLQGIFMSFSAIFRSNAMMKEIMLISVVSNVCNVFGNLVLINGIGRIPSLGVKGAAISTVCSLFISVVLILVLYGKRIRVPLRFSYIRRPDVRKIGMLFKVGIPAAGDSISYNSMQLVMISFINRFGAEASAVKAYVGMVVLFVYMCSSAIAQATQIKVGYAVGAGEVTRAKGLVVKSTVTSVCISVFLSSMLYLFCEPVFSIFTDHEGILRMVKEVLRVDLFLEAGRAVNMVMINALLASGDTRYPVGCAVVSMWLIAVPVGYYASVVLGMGITGVWIGLAVDEWCRAVLFLIRWKGNKWQQKRLFSERKKEELYETVNVN